MNTNVEINCRSVKDTEEGKEVWDIELITDNNDLWTFKEPLLTAAQADPDRDKIEKDFFVNRHLFKLLGNYYVVKEEQRKRLKEEKQQQQGEDERIRKEVQERESKLPQHAFTDNTVLIGDSRVEIENYHKIPSLPKMPHAKKMPCLPSTSDNPNEEKDEKGEAED